MHPKVEPTALHARYQRAAQWAPPKLAMRTVGHLIEGHWIDHNRFYFIAEHIEPGSHRVQTRPSIVNASTGTLAAAAPLDIPAPNVPALRSPDGRFACFVRGYNLWLKDRRTGNERPLTTDGTLHRAYGRQSETGLNAISYRQHPSPVGLWSPDSTRFLTHLIDERSVPSLALVQNVPEEGGRPILHRFKYPMPGDALPTATFVAIDIASGTLTPFQDCQFPITVFSPFTVRTVWFGDSQTAWFVRSDRYFKEVELIELNLEAGIARRVFQDSVKEGYFDTRPTMGGPPNIRILQDSNEFIWYSEQDGWGHLYLHDLTTGRLKNRITHGEWLVSDIAYVDEANRIVWFLAAGIDPNVDPAHRSLCRVGLDGTDFTVVLSHDGDIAIPAYGAPGYEQAGPSASPAAPGGVSPDGRWAIVNYASATRGNEIKMIDLHTRSAVNITQSRPQPTEPNAHHFRVLAADGQTPLYGTLFLPSDFDPTGHYPLIDYVYPAPSATQQPQSFRSLNASPAMALAELGLAVMMLDTRGVAYRSRAIHQAGYGSVLEPQLADHAAAVRQLCDKHAYLDPDRVGVLGHSAGGAGAARAMFDYGDIFKVGVAVCGNHDTNAYAAVWSDKYRGPGEPDSWREQANASVAGKLTGHLLLIAGDMDENVHVSQTLTLADALIRANRDFELLIVPNAGHEVMLTHPYALRRIWDFFVRNLLDATPPPNFELKYEPHELARFWELSERESRQ